MTRARLYASFVGTALVAALFGFLFGWYQAYPAQHSRDRALLRLRLSEARARTVDARVAFVNANYGDARTHVDEAIRLLDVFRAANQRDLPATEAAKIEQAQQLLKEAQALAAAPPAAPPANGGPMPGTQADARAQQAANLLGEVYRATPEP